MGLTPEGQGARAIAEGWTQKDGKLPVNPSGGLKAKGHPIGATGVSMHALTAMQLTGTAGDMQLQGAEAGRHVQHGRDRGRQLRQHPRTHQIMAAWPRSHLCFVCAKHVIFATANIFIRVQMNMMRWGRCLNTSTRRDVA